MWTPVFLTAALALGQPGVTLPDIAPNAPPIFRTPTFTAVEPPVTAAPEAAPDEAPKPVQITAPLLPAPPAKPAAAAAAAPVVAPPPRWFLMKELQGTYFGSQLDGNRIAVYGWAEMSGTLSSAGVSNEPMAWNDRANRALLQQFFVRVERPVVTTGTTMPTFGFRSDTIIGSDYRFTLPRGIFNGQLINSSIDPNTGVPTQNLYGVDPVEFYGEAYIPNIQQGLDIKVGRFYTPFGEESIEAVSTPLVSRSYTFNNGPPFTHIGVLATLTIDPVWTVAGGLVDGNDIVFDDGGEARFVGFAKWTQPSGGRNTVTFGTSVGRGKFNTGAPFATENPGGVTVSGIGGETFGRNNINVFDLLYTHTFNPVLSYAAEGLYGYQTGVPPNLLPGDHGLLTANTAHWASLAQYLIYQMSPRLTGTLRAEVFEDFEGQRTGAQGFYTAVTTGLAFKARPGLIIRPELRYDRNGNQRPFDFPYHGGAGEHDLFTAAMDVIVRW
jgi:Putative beta-barrel porin-2, OmpL-like. bbp2